MKALTLTCLLLFTINLNGQKNLWFEAGPEADFPGFRILDKNTYLLNGHRTGANYSFRLRREFSEIFSLETGLNRGFYNEKLAVSSDRYWYTISSSAYFQIPLLLYAQKPLVRNRIYAVATLGLQLTFDDFSVAGSNSGIYYFSGTQISYECTQVLQNNYLLFQGNAGLRFRLFDQLSLTLVAGMNRSFSTLHEYNIEYTDPEGNIYSWTETLSTSYVNFNLSLSYPVNRAVFLAKRVLKRY